MLAVASQKLRNNSKIWIQSDEAEALRYRERALLGEGLFPVRLKRRFSGEQEALVRPPFWPESQYPVKYLMADERVKIAVQVDEAGRLIWADGTLVHTSDGAHPFALDCDGQLYVYPATRQMLLPEKVLIRHSSILAGAPGAAFGNLKVDQGVVTLVTRDSGHYRPDKDAVRTVEDVLGAKNVDLTQATFKLKLELK